MSEIRDRNQPETLRLRGVMPTMTVDDLHASIAFYRDVLGFVVVDEMMHEGEMLGAALRAGVVEILIGQDDWGQGRDRKKGVGMRLYCTTVQDVDRLAADIVARGGELATEPKDQSWGARDFSVVDPDGFKITISTGVVDDEEE